MVDFYMVIVFMVNKLINMVNTDKYGRYSASLDEQMLLEDELMKDMSYGGFLQWIPKSPLVPLNMV